MSDTCTKRNDWEYMLFWKCNKCGKIKKMIAKNIDGEITKSGETIISKFYVYGMHKCDKTKEEYGVFLLDHLEKITKAEGDKDGTNS